MPVLTSRTEPILIAFLIAAAACIHVARKIYRSGVEHHGSRILLLSALIDTALVALMLLLSGLVSLSDLMQSGGPRLATCFVVLSLFILPARSIWNYATVTQRIAQRLGLKPCGVNDRQAEVAKLADVMDIAAPLVYESASLRTPVVYGVHSRKAHLAIPTDWGTADARSREVMLCHELAHIRNRDVGFLTWSFAFLRDLKWMLVLAPAVVILSSVTEKIFPRQAILLYAACLCILWILTNVVVKRRELLADRTVAMLINSGQIGQAVDELLLVPSTALYPSAPGLVRVVVPMQNWLADKALFSRRPMIWKLVLRLVESVVSPHPSARSRVKAIHERNAAVEQAFIDRSEAFWAGITLGLLGVFISLAGFWAGKFLLGWQDDERIERLCYDCLGCAAPMAIGYVALFFVLPAWAAVRLSSPTLRPVLGLATRYICALLGAYCVSPLILLGGWSYIEIKVVFVLNLIWTCFVLTFAACVTLVMLFLWGPIRHKRRYFLTDLRWALYSYGLGVFCLFGHLSLALALMLSGRGLAGGSVALGLLAGLAVLLFVAKGSISGTEQYMVVDLGLTLIYLEGKTYRRWSPLIGALQIVVCLIPAAVISATTYGVGYLVLGHVGDLTATAVIVVCAVLLVIQWRSPRRVVDSSTRKIGALVGALAILERPVSIRLTTLADELLGSLQDRKRRRSATGVMTTWSLFALTKLVPSDTPLGDRLSERIRQWAVACQTDRGFGPWPGGGPRLACTYQCLRMLRRTGTVTVDDAESHISWILGLLEPDGSFRGPWSKRVKWEDTFFAVASLGILDADLPTEVRARCLSWTRHTLVAEGTENRQLDALHYCLAALQILGGLDDEIATTVANRLSVEMDRLLLTNIAHNAENICHAVQACHILEERMTSVLSLEQKGLLADRINAALEAELAASRI